MQGRVWRLMGVLLPGFVGLTGCQPQLSPQAEALLAEGAAAYRSGQYDTTVRRMDVFLQDPSSTSRADEAYYLRGLAKSRLKDVPGARFDLEEAVRRARQAELKGKALVELGEIAFQGGEAAEAERLFTAALKDVPENQPPADIAHYRLGCLLQRRGRWADADVHFSRLMFLFEGTPMAQRAASMVRCTAWTVQVGAFASARNAEAMTQQLREKGLPVNVEKVTRDGKLLHQVQVGRYSAYEQATAALVEVRKYARDALVIPTR